MAQFTQMCIVQPQAISVNITYVIFIALNTAIYVASNRKVNSNFRCKDTWFQIVDCKRM